MESVRNIDIEADDDPILLTIHHKGNDVLLSFPSTTTVADMFHTLSNRFGLELSTLKVIFQGQNLNKNGQQVLVKDAIKQTKDAKLMLLGTR